MVFVVAFLCALLIAGIFLLARPSNIYDDPNPRRYILMNDITERPMYMGRQFRSPKQAALYVQRRYKKGHCLVSLAHVSVRQVILA